MISKCLSQHKGTNIRTQRMRCFQKALNVIGAISKEMTFMSCAAFFPSLRSETVSVYLGRRTEAVSRHTYRHGAQNRYLP